MGIIAPVLMQGLGAEVEPASGPTLQGTSIMEPLDTDPYYSRMDSATSKMKIAGSIMLSHGSKQSEMHQPHSDAEMASKRQRRLHLH